MAEKSTALTPVDKFKAALSAPSTQKKFEEILGKRSAGFITSLTSAFNNNTLLQKVEPKEIILCASNAAILDLPITPQLGYSALVPFNDTKTNTTHCTLQIQRDGWVELLQRTGMCVRIANEVVYDGELVAYNRFRDEYVFDETKRKYDDKGNPTVIGYMAYMRLTTGFEKTVYWTVEEVKAYATKYSQTYIRGIGLWKDNFNAMALKTVLKHLIKKYAPKSIEVINRAIEVDDRDYMEKNPKQKHQRATAAYPKPKKRKRNK